MCEALPRRSDQAGGLWRLRMELIRWVVDTEKCIPHFISLRSCAICIQVCPWNAKALDQTLRSEYKQDAQRFKSFSPEFYEGLSFAENPEKYL